MNRAGVGWGWVVGEGFVGMGVGGLGWGKGGLGGAGSQRAGGAVLEGWWI